MEYLDVNTSFWSQKRILVTGHTGFKGGWLCVWLKELGADVHGVSLPPVSFPNFFEKSSVSSGMQSIYEDIRDSSAINKIFLEVRPEIVIHMAAQPLVRKSYADPVETYATNVMGTLNILEAIRSVNTVRAGIMVTTDKCYENHERLSGYKEHEPMGGHDPYSSSKACAELLISSYRRSFFSNESYDQHGTSIASVRAGNVIGGGDWAEDRLIPDFIRAIEIGEDIIIRNPNAIRPWQHVLDALFGYLELAENLYEDNSFVGAWNFGPREGNEKPVQWVVDKLIQLSGKNVSWKADDRSHPHEANYLKLDCEKANSLLGWHPKWDLENALERVMEWHLADMSGGNLSILSLQQISEYMNEA